VSIRFSSKSYTLFKGTSRNSELATAYETQILPQSPILSLEQSLYNLRTPITNTTQILPQSPILTLRESQLSYNIRY
jgi:hypothetical protein